MKIIKKIISIILIIIILYIMSKTTIGVFGITTGSIGVALKENGEIISQRNYDDGYWDEKTGTLFRKKIEDFKPGKIYNENITVYNSGAIDIYARVIIYRYFSNADGEKAITLSPEVIGLKTGSGDWIIDENATTLERTVFYYKFPIAVGETSSSVITGVQLSPDINKKYISTEKGVGNGKYVITTKSEYEGYEARIEIEVDAVQTHNAKDAIKSSWGVDVNIDTNGNLSLK